MNAPIPLLVPPHSTEAEQAVLGAVMMDNSAMDRIADVLRESDFYRDDHRRIYRHMTRLLERGQPADVLTVAESLERSNESELSGGLAYLVDIANNTPSAANVRRYAVIVADRAMRRALLLASDEAQGDALRAGDESAQERLDKALGRFMALSEARIAGGEPTRISDSLGEVVDLIEQRAAGGGVPGLSTGFADLDARTTGLHDGQLIIIAGRPAMGKTAFALNIAENCALGGGVAAVFSMEMTKAELTQRSLASVGGIRFDAIRTGALTHDDWDLASAAMGKLHEARLVIDDTGGLTLGQLRAKARRIKRREKRLDLVVIDYLQMMEADRSGETRNTELTAISRGLKAMAKDLSCPVVALSQLSRKVEERPNKRPFMSDIRESGAIEQDADVILLMYREEYYKPDTQDKGVAEVIIGKQRNGSTGEVRLSFQGEYCRFRNFTSFADVSLNSMRSRSRGKGFEE